MTISYKFRKTYRIGGRPKVPIFRVSVILSAAVLLYLFIYSMGRNASRIIKADVNKAKDIYLLNTDGCKIHKLDPFHVSVKRFIKHLPDLKCSFKSILLLANSTITVSPKYSNRVKCFFQSISRKDDSTSLVTSINETVNGSLDATSEFIKVECDNRSDSLVNYRQFYPFITLKPKVEERVRDLRLKHLRPQVDETFSIMMLGLDSVSKNQFLRHMPKTRKFIKRNLTYVELNGYNKVGKDTYSNVLPTLTGQMADEVNVSFNMDGLPFIWKDYTENGYRTMFGEDAPKGSIFNYGRKGFNKQPVDYYLRPWSLEVERYITKWKKGCLGDRIEANVILKWMEDFFDFFPTDPLFAFTYLTRMSHDDINYLSYQDKPVRDLFERLLLKGHLNNTIVFFFGDHGFRYGEMRRSVIGRMEGRLPLMFILLPPWFPGKYPKLYQNLKVNEFRLTTPLDIHATLKDLLHFRVNGTGHEEQGRNVSLLRTQVSQNRTCEEANIKSQWCACVNLEPVALNDSRVLRSAKEMVKKINSITAVNRSECASLTLLEVLNASKHDVELGENSKHDGFTSFLISIKVTPSKGIFEGTVWFTGGDTYSVQDSIERINWYGNQSACIHVNALKPYCYCEG